MIYGGGGPASPFPAVLADAYATKGTAALGVADTGHPWWIAESTAASRLSVIGGKLTNTTTDAAVRAGYVTTRLPGLVASMSATFTLSATTNPGGGVVALIAWRWPYGSVSGVPDTGMHLICSDISWSLTVWENQAQSSSLGGATFGTPLATNGTTVHTISVAISGTTATVTPPTGAAVPITDARIASLAGRFPGFEVYQSNASTDTRAGILTVAAS